MLINFCQINENRCIIINKFQSTSKQHTRNVSIFALQYILHSKTLNNSPIRSQTKVMVMSDIYRDATSIDHEIVDNLFQIINILLDFGTGVVNLS